MEVWVSLHHLRYLALDMIHFNAKQWLQLQDGNTPAMFEQAVLNFPLELCRSDVSGGKVSKRVLLQGAALFSGERKDEFDLLELEKLEHNLHDVAIRELVL